MDKNVIYMSDDARMDSIITFIRKHYQPEANYVQIGEFCNGLKFFKVVSENDTHKIRMENYQNRKDFDNIEKDVKVIEDECEITVSGTLYENKSDSYYQRVYMVIKDTDSEAYQVFPTVKKEVAARENALCGKYGDFYVTINKSDIEYRDYIIETVLICDNVLHEIVLDRENT